MASRKLEVQIIGDASSLSKAFGKASDSSNKFGRALGKTAKYAGLAIGAAGIGGLAVVLKAGITEFSEAAKVGAQTAAVLKSTGGAAKVTAQEVSGLAEALMRKTGVDDEAIQSGENMLLTFKSIRNEVGEGNDIFNQATKATLDLSVAMGTDMSKSAIMVGKALNDPVRGLGAMRRVGIQFTDAQETMIKGMVKSGDVMGAQKVILQELNSQFGGSAEAIGKTLPGQLAILRESFSNLSGQIVSGLAPAFTVALNSLSGFMSKLSAADGAGAKLNVVWTTIKTGAVSLGTSLKQSLAAIDFKGIAGRLWTGLVSAVTSINWGALGSTVGKHLTTAFNKLASVLNSVNWNAIGQTIVAGIGRALAALGRFLQGVNWPQLFSAMSKGMQAVMAALGNLLLGLGTAAGRAALNGIKAGAVAAWGPLSAWIKGIPGKIAGFFGNMANLLVAEGRAVLDGFWNGLKSKWGDVTSWLSGLAPQIPKWKGPMSKDKQVLVASGQAIMAGLLVGLESGWLKNVAFLRGVAAAAVKEINALNAQLNAITARREAQDRAAAVRDATAALAEARKKKEGVVAAELALARAREDIVVAGLNRQLAKEQAALERRKAMITAKMAAITSAVQKASDKMLSLFDRATGGHVTVAGAELDAISARRQQEDLASAVSDAQTRLGEAQAGGDAAAIAEAQRALARAQEDIQIASLEAQKVTQEQAWTTEREKQREHLEARLATLAASFTKEGATVKTAMKALDKLMLEFGTTFAQSGQIVGQQFVRGLTGAIGAGVAGGPQVATAGGTSGSRSAAIPVVQVLLDGKVLAESNRKENAIYGRANA